MKKILYISDTPLNAKSGGGLNGRMHHQIINSFDDAEVYNLFITKELVPTNEKTFWICANTFMQKFDAILHGNTPYLSEKVVRGVYQLIEELDVSIVYIDNSISGNLIRNIKKRYKRIFVIAFFHDIEIVKMKHDKNISLLRRMVLPLFFKNEKMTVEYADRTIVLNNRERDLYITQFKKEPDFMVPICVPDIEDTMQNEEQHSAGERLKLLFVGVDYGPNVSGIRWFLKKVYPKINGEFEISIVGYNMEKYKCEFENLGQNICVIGTVKELKKYYDLADAVIAPIMEGGGMKVKTAEAFSYGKRFIGCDESLVGYWEDIPENFRNHKIYRADSESEFAMAIDNLYDQTFYKDDKEIRTWAKKMYSYKSNFNKYKEIFEFGGEK